MATVNATDIPTVKLESGPISFDADEPRIKQDPDFAGGSPAALSDDDMYEDAGDLDFSNAQNGVWLTRLPKFLWENWSKIGDDEEIQLGTIRLEDPQGDNTRMSLLLSPDIAQNKSVPKEYNLHSTNSRPGNTFIFTEKDLPGFTSKLGGGGRGDASTGPASYPQVPPRPQFQDRAKAARQTKYDKGARWQPYFRKAVPKQTAIAGQVQTEINCLPVENDEYRQIMEERTKQALKPKRETKFLTGKVSTHAGNLLAPGTLGPSGNFSSFIKTTAPPRGKQPDLKAARMPQNELLDLIYNCFKRYNYWPLKSLKAELNQPENYLKQTLEMVAQLVKAGPHANTWQLKPEARISTYADARSYDSVKDEVAPEAGLGLDGASDLGEVGGSDDEDEIKMEDVFPS